MSYGVATDALFRLPSHPSCHPELSSRVILGSPPRGRKSAARYATFLSSLHKGGYRGGSAAPVRVKGYGVGAALVIASMLA